MSLSISVNNSNRLPQDALVEIFELSGTWEAPLPCVCKEWRRAFKIRNQWTILTGLIAQKRMPNHHWWQQQIDTVKDCNSSNAPKATLMRDLNHLVGGGSFPHCSRIYAETSRLGRDQNTLLSLVNPNLSENIRRGQITKFIALALGKELIVRLNQECKNFVSAILEQTSPGVNPQFDMSILQGRVTWNGHVIELAQPAFPSQARECVSIIRSVTPEFFERARENHFGVQLSDHEREILNRRFTQYGEQLRCTIDSLTEWRMRKPSVLQIDLPVGNV